MPQQDALLRLAESIRDGTGAFPALRGDPRRATCRASAIGARLRTVQTTDLAAQQQLARALDRSYLLVQGPPGTGKTYTGARLIVDLIAAGHRVGVTALSHRAINNLLAAVEEAADEAGVDFEGARTGQRSRTAGSRTAGARSTSTARRLPRRSGTAWSPARPGSSRREEFDGALDYLVIDEAGQLSLADALAAGTAARNLILLGDPLQLPQVSQAIHPPGTNASVLEHLLGLHATVPEDRGLFLDRDVAHAPGRLPLHLARRSTRVASTARRAAPLQSTGAGTGIRFLPVEHAGNGNQSREEAEAIRERDRRAARRSRAPIGDGVDAHRWSRRTSWSSRRTTPRSTCCSSVLPRRRAGRHRGSPSRARRRRSSSSRWRRRAARTCRATSAFLFSRNRLNVAISRAQCLAILCCSPALLETKARTIEEMRLISTLCALVETAEAATV